MMILTCYFFLTVHFCRIIASCCFWKSPKVEEEEGEEVEEEEK